MPQQRFSPAERHDLRTQAREIYETIANTLEPRLQGKIVAIEVESAEYFVGETVLDAANKARATHADKVFHFFRIGFPTVYVWR